MSGIFSRSLRSNPNLTFLISTMRPLTEEETKIFFEKLAKYIGRNIKFLIDRPDEPHCFRLHDDRVFYVSESVLKVANSVGREELHSMGTNMGKFTRTKKFRLHVTALDILAQYAKYKVWVKPSAEMAFLYGNHIIKAGLGRITENTPKYQGVVIYNMADLPIGFGITAATTDDCRRLEATGIVVFHQADVGEFLRDEDSLS